MVRRTPPLDAQAQGYSTPGIAGEDEHWIVEYVAVAPGFRQRGVCNQLMLAVLDQGRARGFKRAQITPYADNEASVKAYEKVGFKGTPPMPCVAVARMRSFFPSAVARRVLYHHLSHV
jgi:ribosomal protein S18 acetylase RimI-like enzyme